jgi:predicted RNA-binding protein with TRAM domain
MRGRFPSKPPVEVGDELDVTIEAVGEKGDGIARKDGFILFIPNTREGEQVHIKVTKVLRKVGFAEVASSSGPSPEAQETEVPAEEPADFDEQTAEPENTEDFGEESEDFGEEIPPAPDEAGEEMEPELPPPPEDSEDSSKKEE